MPVEALHEPEAGDQLTDRFWAAQTDSSAAVSRSLLTPLRAPLRQLKFPARQGVFVVQLSGPTPAWVVGTIEDMIKLLDLPENWDSYGAKPVSPARVSQSLRILFDVIPPDAPAPTLAPTTRGEIQAEWKLGPWDVELEMHADGSISLLAEHETSSESNVDLERSNDRAFVREVLVRILAA